MASAKFAWNEAPPPSVDQLAAQYDSKMGAAFEMFDSSRFVEAALLFEGAADVCALVSKGDAQTTAWVSRKVKALNNSAACNDKLGRLEAAARGYAAARAHLTSAWSDYMFPSLWDSSYASMLAHVDKKLGMMPRDTRGAHVGLGVDVASVLDVGKQMVLEAVELYKAAEFARALPLLEQALAIHEKHAPTDGITLATIANNLASTHAEMGHEAEARALYLRALQIGGATDEQRAHVKKKLALLGKRAGTPQAAGAAQDASSRGNAAGDIEVDGPSAAQPPATAEPS
ncbi:hypothetical protein KFE25_011021 [Diacronema lutheri]|uniref:Tetratricopeptide repeat protein n=2 Tax=Diacronema lutheri TaxID=2081491 RepID=A0A8J5XAU4_DIALT|nr:hypothetical protein KFE25_011021 [Diacronema lutheri]